MDYLFLEMVGYKEEKIHIFEGKEEMAILKEKQL